MRDSKEKANRSLTQPYAGLAGPFPPAASSGVPWLFPMDSIKTERKLLEDQLEGLTEEQMLQPTLEGGWSIKDIMAHTVTWERLMVQWLDTTMHGEIPQMLPPGLTWDDLDIWNERLYVENKDTHLPEVISNFHSSYQIALKTVDGISEEDLINPDRFEWREGKPLSVIVAANTYWHYAEHREQIHNWREDSSI